MAHIVVNYPDDLEQAVQLSSEELSAHLRLMAALKMFELGELSSGKAAEVAGLRRVEFLDACGRYGVPVYNYPPEAMEAELRKDIRVAAEASES